MPFTKALAESEIQIAESRIWTRVIELISLDDTGSNGKLGVTLHSPKVKNSWSLTIGCNLMS